MRRAETPDGVMEHPLQFVPFVHPALHRPGHGRTLRCCDRDHRPHQPVQPVVEQAQRSAKTTPGAFGERSRTGSDEAAFGTCRGVPPGPGLPVMARLPALRPLKTFTLSGKDGRRGARSEFRS